MERGELTRRIKARARQVGFDAVGVASATDLPDDFLKSWLARGRHGGMGYLERTLDKRLNPGLVLSGARSVISLALNYYRPGEPSYREPGSAAVSRYAWGRDYHDVLEPMLEQMAAFVRQQAPGVRLKYYTDTGPVMDKFWATRAGIGWLGKHTNVLSSDAGSWFFLSEIITDLELECDPPAEDLCASCTLCLEACPTEALEPYRIDATRCISYLTIELRDDIPEALRAPMGNLVFGCDLCQDVCPFNQTAPLSPVPDFDPRPGLDRPELRRLARLSEQEFRKEFRGSPLKRAKWRGLMRNVAVAIGNCRDPDLIPELEHLLSHQDALISRHARWALEQMESPCAREVLERLG